MRRESPYIHDQPDWPQFRWDSEKVAKLLASVRHQQGRLIGHMEALGFPLQQEAVLQTLTEDVVKSSEIEGEVLDVEQVRSSVARRLGMGVGSLKAPDRDIEGVVEMMLDATRRFDQPLTAERLFAWHASLFPSGRSGMRKIRAGAWRDDGAGPMQVVSGPIGHERVHFEAPAAANLDREMGAFLDWINEVDHNAEPDLVVKAGLAHLWFVTIHPFDDGNGRIARAIAPASGRRFRTADSTPARGSSSIGYWTVSRVRSRHRSGRRSLSARRTRPCETSSTSSNTAFSSVAGKAGEARAMAWRVC